MIHRNSSLYGLHSLCSGGPALQLLLEYWIAWLWDMVDDDQKATKTDISNDESTDSH